MPYNPEIHHRRSIRLKDYDYTQQGAYFVTICTKAKQCIFGNIKEGKMQLNALGSIADRCWQEIPKHFSHTALDCFIIMPNHLHGILWIIEFNQNQQISRQFGNIVSGSLSSILRSYKSAVTKQINEICDTKGISLVWQSNYYEEIIRDEQALEQIRKYIIYNPLNWDRDEENPRNNSKESVILLDLPF
jgi:REP element-mobilizing transposase RayT